MSIKKRLLFSNVGMIIIPILGFFLIEILLGYILFAVFNGNPEGSDMTLFLGLRFAAMILVLVITNGLLTYYVSRSILRPINELSHAAKRISEGDLGYSVETERKDELGELGNTFEAMRLKLNAARKRQRAYEENRQELLAGITHDLKTPLTSIKGYVKGIQDGVANTPEKMERYIDTISKTTDDMDRLIDELFLYSKLDLEQLPFHFESIDLLPFLTDMLEDVSFDLEKGGGKAVLYANPADDFTVYADRDKLKRAFSNIIQNSVKYMDKERKNIEVHMASNERNVTVEIRDNGSGVLEADLPYIFESFYRADASRNSTTGGSGLGLSIVRKIMDAHGGTVRAESCLGEGTSIYLQFEKVK
ncbi:sensor histidine kinase [Salinicoccus bachuensis]|uniref:histidine kinase n=1 Tax=Salinicoccus bachuensis TaxID=3136731 RepID=A0ABZ3CM98_9STAP